MLLQGDPVLSVEAVDAEASEEGPDPGVFRLMLDEPAATDLTANFRLGGTARRGVDYDLIVNGELLEGLSVTIPAGQTTRDIVMMPIDDALLERTERVALGLRGGTGYALPRFRRERLARIELEDNEPFVVISAIDTVASEANCDPAVFRIARDGSLAHDLPINLLVGGTARLNSDFQLFVDGVVVDDGTIILPAGESSVDVVVVPLDDPFVERTEVVRLALARSRAFAVSRLLRVASVDLVDNEPTLVLSSSGTADEGCLSPAVFRITRDSAFDRDLTVPFRLGGTARLSRDFDLLAGGEVLDTRNVVIPAGDPFVDVVVRPIDDSFVERTEFVALGLGRSRSFRLPSSRDLRVGRADLLDDEPELLITTLDAETGDFGVTEVHFRVRRDGDFDESLTTPLLTRGRARFGRDFRLVVGDEFLTAPVVTIPAGDPFVDVVVVPAEERRIIDRAEIVRFGLPRSRAFTTAPGLRVVTLSL
ncbi:MAG: hypothetical protein ACOC95_07335 [Planctomycetota bacterium]